MYSKPGDSHNAVIGRRVLQVAMTSGNGKTLGRGVVIGMMIVDKGFGLELGDTSPNGIRGHRFA